jgi:hypothetical protein
MSEKSGKISQSVSGSSGVTQQAAKGNRNQQTSETQLSDAKSESVSTLPDATKEDAMTYLNAAKKATGGEEPKKETAAINLKEMAETLANAAKTVEASKGLWDKVQPMLTEVARWLGVAAGSLWTYLS